MSRKISSLSYHLPKNSRNSLRIVLRLITANISIRSRFQVSIIISFLNAKKKKKQFCQNSLFRKFVRFFVVFESFFHVTLEIIMKENFGKILSKNINRI